MHNTLLRVLNKKERVKITNSLKFYRRKKGLSQAKLAKMVGISETHYQNAEYGLTKPNIEIALLLADALETTVEELFKLPSENSSSEKQITTK